MEELLPELQMSQPEHSVVDFIVLVKLLTVKDEIGHFLGE